ncbi:ferredoxin [Capsaspora owczarzaki ATCC 30864]|uniref:Ferredoxin n=1 Tax=Capsaspora owczarzaki (strain ATCC 30864) TaxID=595528 RepID=A0A0D2X2A9_CAPO3|nr:ferredoxin [Capsaspora owczarzaki ATCC 30864]KJE92239.1 ferredoxin [Capsaspora owczarzaki ATCC 30864]|eukprot:XP_004364082.2 ferredoxin [Capsaspora owczarzaki ATCC 30864]
MQARFALASGRLSQSLVHSASKSTISSSTVMEALSSSPSSSFSSPASALALRCAPLLHVRRIHLLKPRHLTPSGSSHPSARQTITAAAVSSNAAERVLAGGLTGALSSARAQSTAAASDKVNVRFITEHNEIIAVKASVGDNILDLAHANNIDLEGACEGTLACSTCHVVLPKQYYQLLPEPEDEENDMLDLAFGLTNTSRLGCQVIITKALEGMDIKLPGGALDARRADK